MSTGSRSAYLFLVLALGTLPSCGLLLGNIKPAAQRSENYGVENLAERKSGWKLLKKADSDDAPAEGLADVSYQFTGDDTVISLNSTCREAYAARSPDLGKYTDSLLLGASDTSARTSERVTVSDQPALLTRFGGNFDGRSVRIKSVVVAKSGCVYDLLYAASPQHYERHETDFDQFVASLRLP